MSPEMIKGKGYDFHVDLWALGVILYQLVVGNVPFGHNTDDPYTIYEEI